MRDRQPKERQAKRAERKLDRAKANRQGLPHVLVVCEGRETEPNYFRGLCEAKRINLANVVIKPGGEITDARSLVLSARELARNQDFDRVFVVVDDDGKPLVEARNEAAKRLSGKGAVKLVELVVTRPAFEFWLLLHFEYSTRPYARAAEVLADLQRHLTRYSKSDRSIFQQVNAGLDRALMNADRLKAELARTSTDNPNTDMNELVNYLLSLAQDRTR